MKWKLVSEERPPIDKIVMTKIDDHEGIRNEQKLKYGSNGLWWHPDGKMYVYYAPTHWKFCSFD